MAATTKERRIAEALHTLVDEVLAPFLARMADPTKQIEILEADLTKPQAARLLNVDPRTLNRYIKSGLLHTLPGGKMITKREVDRFKLVKEKGE
jgi:hypothetical protein